MARAQRVQIFSARRWRPRIVALAPEESSANPAGNDPALIDQL